MKRIFLILIILIVINMNNSIMSENFQKLLRGRCSFWFNISPYIWNNIDLVGDMFIDFPKYDSLFLVKSIPYQVTEVFAEVYVLFINHQGRHQDQFTYHLIKYKPTIQNMIQKKYNWELKADGEPWHWCSILIVFRNQDGYIFNNYSNAYKNEYGHEWWFKYGHSFDFTLNGSATITNISRDYKYSAINNRPEDTYPYYYYEWYRSESGQVWDFISNQRDISIRSYKGMKPFLLKMIIRDEGSFKIERFLHVNVTHTLYKPWARDSIYKNHLTQNYPNPFKENTKITYELADNGNVNLSIYDLMGRKIKTLVNEIQPAGVKRIFWDGRNEYGEKVQSGNYIYSIQMSDKIINKTMTIVK